MHVDVTARADLCFPARSESNVTGGKESASESAEIPAREPPAAPNITEHPAAEKLIKH